MRSTVGGLTALQSTKTGLLLLAVSAGANRCASATASPGGRIDRMKSVAAISSIAGGHHAGGFGARGRLGAAALERGQHLEAVIDEPLSDGSAHHPGRDSGDDRIHAYSPKGARLSDRPDLFAPWQGAQAKGGRAGAETRRWQPRAIWGLLRPLSPHDTITLQKAGNAQCPKNISDLRYQIALANRLLDERRRARRLRPCQHAPSPPSGPLLLSRSRSPGVIEANDILEFTLNSEPVVPPTVQLYAERVIHGCIYQARPDVTAVCHHHAPAVMPFCIAGVPIVPVFHLGAAGGETMPFWNQRDEFGDTNLLVVKPEEGRSLARALGSHAAVLMNNHGATVVGRDLRELVSRSIFMCHNAEYQLQRANPRQGHDPDGGRDQARRHHQRHGRR